MSFHSDDFREIMTVGDLFAGIGGFSLGMQRAGFEIAWQVEIDEWCRKVLAKNFPHAERFGDIRNAGKHNLQAVDVICGGFPCQPFSQAGKQGGTNDDRYLWPEMLRVIQELRPSWVIAENVYGLTSGKMEPIFQQVLSDLESEGYDAQPFIIPACGVDAPHQRYRVWIVANGHCKGLEARQRSAGERDTLGVSTGQSSDVPHPYLSFGKQQRETGRVGRFGESVSWDRARTWEIEPALGRSLDGFPDWMDRHSGIGMSYEESKRATQTLRTLWSNNAAETLRESTRGLGRIQTAEILFSVVRQYKDKPDETRLFLESKKASWQFMRSLWSNAGLASPSHRPEYHKQQEKQHTNSVQDVPRFLAQYRKENGLEDSWSYATSGLGWETGISRVADGIPSRVDRIRGLGNAVVPQIPQILGEVIMQVEKSRS